MAENQDPQTWPIGKQKQGDQEDKYQGNLDTCTQGETNSKNGEPKWQTKMSITKKPVHHLCSQSENSHKTCETKRDKGKQRKQSEGQPSHAEPLLREK